MTVDQVTIDKMMSIYKMIVDEMPPVKMTVNEMTVDKMTESCR